MQAIAPQEWIAPPPVGRSREGVLGLIGNTPLVKLHRLTEELTGIEIWAKTEWKNPGGSVKDRAALRIFEEAERSGALSPEKTLLDATSGNTGIGYALVGAAKGRRVKLVIPGNASPARLQILRAYGAEVVRTDPLEGIDGAILEARRLAAGGGDRIFYADQYSNPANWRAHYDTTGVEILEQSRGLLTHFIAGLGTTGTFVGVARRLAEERPWVKLVSFEPDSPLHGIEGLKHLDSSIVPPIYDPYIADERRTITTEAAQAMVLRLAREEGLLVGISSGAAAAVSLEIAREEAARGEPARIVTVFPDSAEKYMTERFWEESA
jgi:S-sulfo-L-cysteine synthase (O-acetyl-L-serine-dependent)